MSLLSLASGSLRASEGDLFIANEHVPAAVLTDQPHALRFQTSQLRFAHAARRAAFATREGHIYMMSYETAVTETKE